LIDAVHMMPAQAPGLLLALVEDFLNTQTAGQWSGQGAPAIRQGTA
jgi:hypothetical protein